MAPEREREREALNSNIVYSLCLYMSPYISRHARSQNAMKATMLVVVGQGSLKLLQRDLTVLSKAKCAPICISHAKIDCLADT